jgi:hypothetical protein
VQCAVYVAYGTRGSFPADLDLGTLLPANGGDGSRDSCWQARTVHESWLALWGSPSPAQATSMVTA